MQREDSFSPNSPDKSRERVLLVEAGEFTRHRLRSALQEGTREVLVAGTVRDGVEVLRRLPIDLVVVSLSLPELPGLRAVDRFLQLSGGTPVVAVSGQPSVPEAVEVLRRGATDYAPVQADRSVIRGMVERALQEARGRSTKQLERVRMAMRDHYGFSRLLTQSPRMMRVFDEIRQVAVTDATVLIQGETGTGKELVSRAIHERSRRSELPFISVNCGAFTESLLESELFGHEKGSFTGAVGRREGLFEMANGGSLFLDELGETSLNVQVNLLRVLEEMSFRRVGGRETVRVDVRLIAATNVNLLKAVQEGKFREDLFYRLNVFPIDLPPLRSRKEDIPLLLRHFSDELASQYGLEAPVISAGAMEAICSYAWPGNVRQLRAMCERWVITRAEQRLEREHLPSDMVGAEEAAPSTSGPGFYIDDSSTLRENVGRISTDVERSYLYRLLEREEGHLGRTAAAAGVTRRTLYTKLKQYGVDARDFRK
jgi:DNA-binding NtrC family response regulator